MNAITIEDALNFIILNNKHVPDNTVVLNFDLTKLVHIPDKSVYNHNYYIYDGKYLIFEHCYEDDNCVEYNLCLDNDKFLIGSTYCWYKPVTVDLYTSW